MSSPIVMTAGTTPGTSPSPTARADTGSWAGPPTASALETLRGFLLGQGMTEWYLPRRLELVSELPRNPTGKVEKKALRDRLA
jgi:acyl-CoA synthetase (AMP-forming)/AMP-acid ligase II